ncbi:MAG: hypothetical protein R3A10_04840 [Caldilineaceae bacterium]
MNGIDLRAPGRIDNMVDAEITLGARRQADAVGLGASVRGGPCGRLPEDCDSADAARSSQAPQHAHGNFATVGDQNFLNCAYLLIRGGVIDASARVVRSWVNSAEQQLISSGTIRRNLASPRRQEQTPKVPDGHADGLADGGCKRILHDPADDTTR